MIQETDTDVKEAARITLTRPDGLVMVDIRLLWNEETNTPMLSCATYKRPEPTIKNVAMEEFSAMKNMLVTLADMATVIVWSDMQ